MNKQKICVIGDGLTGLTVALFLSKLKIDVCIVGKFKKKISFQDGRTTAISPSNYDFFLNLINKKSSKAFFPSKQIDLFYQEGKYQHHFMNLKDNNKNLMYTIQNNKLKKIIFDQIKKNKNIKIINDEVNKIDEKNSKVFLRKKAISCDCILLCVGRNSKLVKNIMGNRVIENDFKEVAFTTIVKHNLKIPNARQYFFEEGPLAILPINEREFSLVWSVDKNYALERMENLIRSRLNKILMPNKKLVFKQIDFYPIFFKYNVNFLNKNALVLGEGSYSIHPVAGQGFNLILRDIRELGREIEKHLSIGMQIKDSSILRDFVVTRKPEKLFFGLGINFIHEFFKNNKISVPFKKIILKDINKFSLLKKVSINLSNKGIF